MEKRNFLASFRDAFRGIGFLLKERNIVIMIVISVIVLVLMYLFPLKTSERIILFLTIGLVLVAEISNTCLEKTLDHLHPQHHFNIGRVKDMMAAMVLILSIISVIIGLSIFLPYII